MDITKFFKKKESQKRSEPPKVEEDINAVTNSTETKKTNVNKVEVENKPKAKKQEEPKKQEKQPAKPIKKRATKVRAIVSSDESDAFEEPKVETVTKPTVDKKEKSKPSYDIVIEKNPPKETKPTEPEQKQQKPKEKVAVSGAYRRRWGQSDREPPQHGLKPVPIGKANCLEGLVFVLSGLNESLTRDEMSSLITKYGGVERSAISKKTSYLIAGFEMEDGRPITEGTKYRAALEKGIPIINEDGLFKMLYDSNPEGNQKPVSKEETITPKEETVIPKEEKKVTPQITSSAPKKETVPKSMKEGDKTLLTSKYAPKSFNDVIGNRRTIDALRGWLERWEDVHIKKTVTIEWNKQNPGARAVLLSGPPGIGKTTTATLLCHLAGYDIIELNASDKRNMAAVRDTLRDSVSVIGFKRKQNSNTKKVILMDEVDGMSSGDRGGIQELVSYVCMNDIKIKIIKTTQTPIICICNDRDSSKVRTLANNCYDLLFTKPSPMEIQARVKYICDCEGISIPPSTISTMIESTGGDMRQILNQLQILVSLQEKSDLTSVQDIIQSFSKDQLLGVTAFEAGKSLLMNTKTLSLQQRYDMFFCDYEMTPLIVQQNYLMSIKSNGQNINTLMQMADAADALCDCEMVHETMVKNNNWSLLPTMSSLTVRSGYKAAGNFVVPRFPMVLGKYSTIRKNTRLLSEFQNHLSSNISGSRIAITRDYFDMLNRIISAPLMEGNVEEAIKRMDEYAITKDDYVEILNGIKLGDGKSRFELVPTKTKSALTRMYNNTNHSSTNIFADEESMFKKVTKGKKGKKETKSTKATKNIDDMEESESDDVLYDYYFVCF